MRWNDDGREIYIDEGGESLTAIRKMSMLRASGSMRMEAVQTAAITTTLQKIRALDLDELLGTPGREQMQMLAGVRSRTMAAASTRPAKRVAASRR